MTELSEKQYLDIVDDADCNAFVCFTDSSGRYRVLGWAKALILASQKAVYRLPEGKAPLLTDEQILSAFDGDFGEIAFDHKPTAEDVLLIKLRLVAQAQMEGRNDNKT